MEEKLLDIVTLYAPVTLVVLSIVNSLTVHYTKFNGVLRIVMAVIERLSFLASKRSGAKFKAPGKSIPPDPIVERIYDVEKQLKHLAEQKKNRSNSLAGRGLKR